MKSFFDQLGKISEILAPIPGSPSPFFYAIQHHNNAEVQSTLLNSGDVDVTRMTENGYFPIHCACQFNNLFAVDLMMGRGMRCKITISLDIWHRASENLTHCLRNCNYRCARRFP